MSDAARATYNPEFDPTGIEGGVDTGALVWIDVPDLAGVSLEPLRASAESGAFSVIVRLRAGSQLPASVFLGGADLLVLSGSAT